MTYIGFDRGFTDRTREEAMSILEQINNLPDGEDLGYVTAIWADSGEREIEYCVTTDQLKRLVSDFRGLKEATEEALRTLAFYSVEDGLWEAEESGKFDQTWSMTGTAHPGTPATDAVKDLRAALSKLDGHQETNK